MMARVVAAAAAAAAILVVVVAVAAGEEWISLVASELPAYEARRHSESLATGIVHPPLIFDFESATPAELSLAHAKLSCYFDEVDRAETSYAKSAELDPWVAATWHGLGRVRLGRAANASGARSAASAFGRAAQLEASSLLPVAFEWTATRVAEALLARDADDDELSSFLEESVRSRPRRLRRPGLFADWVRGVVGAVLARVRGGGGGGGQDTADDEATLLADKILSLSPTRSQGEDTLAAGYFVMKDVLPDDVHESLLRPWYTHLYTKADLVRDDLVKAGTAGIAIDTLHLELPSSSSSSSSGSVGVVTVTVRGRWHPANRRVELWGEPVADILNHCLTPVVERLLQPRPLPEQLGDDQSSSSSSSPVVAPEPILVPTYPWPVHYGPDGAIAAHLDQSDNEISLSYQVRVFKKRGSGSRSKAATSPRWPLYFLDSGVRLDPGQSGPAELSLDQGAVESAPAITLRNNQGALYRGREVVHWRPPRDDGVELYQLVFAWRRIDDRACHGSI